MKLKQTLAAAALAAMTTTSALAETGTDAFTATDMATLFEQDAQPLQLAALSEQEMKETEGAWFMWELPVILKFDKELNEDGFFPITFDPFGSLYFKPWW